MEQSGLLDRLLSVMEEDILLRIMAEVFGCSDCRYRENNAYWTSHELGDLIDPGAPGAGRRRVRINALKREYAALSDVYQRRKEAQHITLK